MLVRKQLQRRVTLQGVMTLHLLWQCQTIEADESVMTVCTVMTIHKPSQARLITKRCHDSVHYHDTIGLRVEFPIGTIMTLQSFMTMLHLVCMEFHTFSVELRPIHWI